MLKISRAGRTELIISGNELIISYDPATAKELWSTKGLESNAISSPVNGHMDGIRWHLSWFRALWEDVRAWID